MRLSDGVEWGVHTCTVLAVLPPDRALPAAKLAEYHGVPAAYLAKHLQSLARAGVLETVKGPRGGYRLARPAPEITLLDVVEAIDGDAPAFRCSEIRRRGPSAVPAREYTKLCGINRAFLAADEAWRAELARVTVADMAVGALEDAPRAALVKSGRWLADALPPID
ncbi:MAG: RrF2 family transcriptional regulator [Acidimicrobiia bacterium]